MTKYPFVKHKVKPHTCPFCKVSHDGVTNVTGTPTPVTGDVTMCIECGEWAIFADVPGRLRKPTDAEYDKIVASEVATKARKAWLLTQIALAGRKK
jgi:hypothetical protein